MPEIVSDVREHMRVRVDMFTNKNIEKINLNGKVYF